MEMNQRIEICGTCTQRKFGNQGIICGLTLEKPAFELNCPDYEIDERQWAKKRKSNFEDDFNFTGNPVEKESHWKTALTVLIFILIVIRFLTKIF